jgi:four helix bundle protein
MIAVVLTYRLSMAFPADERFGLSAQMRRAAVLVPSNIAEGQARKSPRAFIHYIGVALGSLAELDTQLDVAIRLQYISAEAAGELQGAIESGRRLLFGLRRAQKRRLALSLGGSTAVLLLALRLFA